jgi:xanthine dehydrogenase YagR molybdenum-binding subunit
LVEYHVSTNADVGEIDVPLDILFDLIGAHGIGEIEIIATGATISNAVFHALGRQARELLITPTN